MSWQLNGGAAFPTAPENHGYQAGQPAHGTGAGPGMSLRDYFAAAALQGMLANSLPMSSTTTPATIAHACYVAADAMLDERDRN